ncbi:pyocin knob domain-containing protein [Aliihoeflea sp. PC F10.4]
MALISYYSQGTASVAANGTVVTGQGTLWVGSVKPGDQFRAGGLTERILSVNSNTSLTLARGWPGAARTAAAYEVYVVPAPSEIVGTTRTLLTSLSSGVLSAFAGLTSAANKLPFFTGSGTMDVTDLSAKGREIIGAADSAAARSAVGAMQNLDAPNEGGAPLDSNFNDYTDPGPAPLLLRSASGGPNAATAPVVNTYFYVLNFAYGANRTQVAFPYGSADYTVYSRTRTGASWSEWRAVVSDATNIISGVFDAARIPGLDASKIISGVFDAARIPGLDASKIISGVFDAARIPQIIEYGINGNGRYIRFSNGVQICWQVYAATSRAMTTAYGSIFTGPTLSRIFPVNFSAIPAFFPSIWDSGGGRPDARTTIVSNAGASYVLSHPQSNTLSVGDCWVAVGNY